MLSGVIVRMFSLRVAALLQVDCEVGTPRVNYREAIQSRATFDYLHKKQSGGQVQQFPLCRLLQSS